MGESGLLERLLRQVRTPDEKRDKLKLAAATLDELGVERKAFDGTLSVSKALADALMGRVKMAEEDIAEITAGVVQEVMAGMDEKGYATDDNREAMQKTVMERVERMMHQMRDDAELANEAGPDEDKADEEPDADKADEEPDADVKALTASVAALADQVKALTTQRDTALLDAVKDFGEVAEAQAQVGQVLEALVNSSRSLSERVKGLEAMTQGAPRRASQAATTLVSDDDPLAQKARDTTIDDQLAKFGLHFPEEG